MNIEIIKSFLMWCSVINYGVLFFWVGGFVFARDFFKSFCEKSLRCKIEYFDILNVFGITLYKLLIILFNLVPWVVLSLIIK